MKRPFTSNAEPRLRWAALAAGVVAVLTRIPFAARRMWDHDSVQFALGVEKYDLAAHHPHPPGYPLYIGILKLLAALGVDSLHGMVAMSILASGIGAGLLVLLVAGMVVGEGLRSATPLLSSPHPHSPPRPGGRDAIGSDYEGRRILGMGAGRGAHRRPEIEGSAAKGPSPLGGGGVGMGGGQEGGGLLAGLFAAALYIFDPLLWFYGELPLLYAVEGGLTVAVAWAAWRMEESRGKFLFACALLAFVGGLRQSTLILLSPLFLYGVYRTWRRGRLTWGLFLSGAALGGALVLAWFVPLSILAGGYGAYRRISAEHFATLLPQTSILYGAGSAALAHNLTVLAKWAIQGLLPGAVALAALFAVSPGAIRGGVRLLAARAPFLAAWAFPPLLFFALFHVTKGGYTLVHLPALLAGLALLAAPGLLSARGRVLAFALVVAIGGGLFLFGADRTAEQSRLWFPIRNEWNRGTLATYERELDEMIATVRQYPPESTVLVAAELSGTGSAGAEGFLYSWHRHLQWYLPEYLVVMAVPEEDFALVARGHEPLRKELSQVEVPAGTQRLLFVLSGPTGDRLPLGPGAVGSHDKNFYLTVVPFAGRRQVGPLVFTAAAPARKAA